MIRALSKEELTERWSEIKPYIDSAIQHGIQEQTSFDMFLGCMKGTYECWECVQDGKSRIFSMVRINHFPDHSQLQYVAAGGEGFEDWGQEAFDYLEAVAKKLGCKYTTIWGRPGWKKKLQPLGYEHVYTVMAKEIK